MAGCGAAGLGLWLIFFVGRGPLVSSLRARLARAEERIGDFELHLHGKTPSAAAARLRHLEAHVAALPPRRLTDGQKSTIAEAAGCPPPQAPYMTVTHDTVSAEAARYARDFIEAFTAAPGWNVVEEPYTMMPHPPTLAIAVGLGDPAYPTATEQRVLEALATAGVRHDILAKSPDARDAEIIISAR